jgi:hypothetical protein
MVWWSVKAQGQLYFYLTKQKIQKYPNLHKHTVSTKLQLQTKRFSSSFVLIYINVSAFLPLITIFPLLLVSITKIKCGLSNMNRAIDYQ